MKKGTLGLIFFIASLSYSFAQINLQFSTSDDPVPGGTMNVDVSVSDFVDINSKQYWVRWDSDILSFSDVSNVTPNLLGFDENSFGTPDLTGNLGQMSVSWNDFDAEEPFGNLPDGEILFSMEFLVIGMECDSTALTIGDGGPFQLIEVTVPPSPFPNIGLTFEPLPVKIPGEDCTDDPPTEDPCGIENANADVIISAADDICGEPGEVVCVPVTVQGFTDVSGLQGGIAFDTNLVKFNSVQNLNLPPPFPATNFNLFTNDSLTFIWFDNSGLNPATVMDGETIFELCFDVCGDLGECAAINLADVDNSFWDVSGPSGSLELATECGKINIESKECQLDIIAGNVTTQVGQEACLPITAQCFDDILSFQYTLSWDENLLTYEGLKSLSTELPLFEGGNINFIPPNSLTVSWNSPSGVCTSFPDGTLLYEVAFTCTAEGTASVFFTETPSEFEVTNCDADIIPSTFTDGSVTCTDNVDPCATFGVGLTPTDVLCAGEETGSISVQQMNGVGPFVCMWENGAGQTVGNSSCQLLNVGADTYSVTITDANNCVAEANTTVAEPDNPMSFSSTVATDADCDMGGTLAVNVTGGTGNYSYNWNNGLPNQNAHSNVPANTYTVTVSDDNGCMINTSLEVGSASEITVTGVVTNETCDSQGAIDITVEGSNNVSVDWEDIPGSPNVEDRVGLSCEGSPYNVTVTETNTGCTATASFTVECEIPDLTLSVTPVHIDCDNIDGSIIVDCEGGCPNTEFECLIGGVVFPCNDLGGLTAGSYQFCKREIGNPDNTVCQDFTIENNLMPLELDGVDVTSPSCAGESDGTATPSFSGGCPSYECFIDNVAVDCDDISLGAGSYTFCVRDGLNSEECVNIEITDPEAITITTVIVNNGDGTYTIEGMGVGGTGTLTYTWMDCDSTVIAMTQNLENITPGCYLLMVTDENGCSSVSDAINVSSETTVGPVTVISEAEFNGFGVSCFGSCDGMISADILTGIAPFEIVITDANTNALVTTADVFPIDGLCAGDYTMVVTDAFGAASAPVAFSVTEPDLLDLQLVNVIPPSDMGVSDGTIETSLTGGVPPYEYNWSPTGPNGPVNTNVPEGTYTLEVIDFNGCDAILTNIEVGPGTTVDCIGSTVCYEAMSIFTPNGDGMNDMFQICCLPNGDHIGTQLEIYDRYGRRVHGFVNYDNTWNGVDENGVSLIEGAYYWVLNVEFANGVRELFKGTVTILRD